MNARLVRLLSVAALPLVTGGWLGAAAAEESSDGPRYTYFEADYAWIDTLYAIEETGGQFDGIKLSGSADLVKVGPVGIRAFVDFFDGNFSGVSASCDLGSEGIKTINGDQNAQSLAAGLGAHYPVFEKTDIVLNAAYVDISEFQIPNDQCDLVSTDDHGYSVEGLVRSELSDNVEIEAGFRYSKLNDSDLSNNDVLLGISYNVNKYLALRATGIVFDTDAGFELGARIYFDSFLGRDTIF